jgi:hypothetical protein
MGRGGSIIESAPASPAYFRRGNFWLAIVALLDHKDIGLKYPLRPFRPRMSHTRPTKERIGKVRLSEEMWVSSNEAANIKGLSWSDWIRGLIAQELAAVRWRRDGS